MYLAEIGKLIMFHYKTGLLPDIFQNILETKEIEINLRLKNFCNLNSILTCNIYMFVFCNLQCNHAIVPAYGWFLVADTLACNYLSWIGVVCGSFFNSSSMIC